MHRTLLRASLLFAISLVGCASSGQPGKQVAKAYDVTVPVRYLEYLPPTYKTDAINAADGGHGWPLVLFLHGAGERGEDVNKVKVHGPPKLVAQGKDFPFILISPQAPTDSWWDAGVLGGLLDEIERTHQIDRDRVYVTGLSMGGFGTWELARRYPSRFAAIAPICGGTDATLTARNQAFKTLPVWAFHGDADPVIPVSRSAEAIDALQKAGNAEAKITVYPGVGHDSWTATYANPELYAWLLSHKRK